jgi:NDP-sugar pyrophosphorylase family protein
MSSIRHAIVLAAGLGTRLLPLTSVRAKPAVPVAGEPIVRRAARWLVAHQVTDLVVNLHHLPGTVTARLGDGSDVGASVRYSWEQPVVLGSAGGPRQALPILGADTFFVVNGDTLTDLDLDALATAHASSGALVTLAVVPNREPERYGGVMLDRERRVTRFVGRGRPAAGSFHFIGVQVAAAEAFRSLPEKHAINSIGDVYDRLIASRPGSVSGLVCSASFWDIGTVADYVTTSRAFEKGPSPVSSTTRIDASASLTRSIVWDDVQVGPHAELEECILTDGVRVPAGVRYRRMILMRGTGGALVTVPAASDRG